MPTTHSQFLIFPLLLLVSSCLSPWGTYRPGQLFSLVHAPTSQTLQFGVVQRVEPTVVDFNQDDIRTLDSQVEVAQYALHDGSSFFQKVIWFTNGDGVNVRGIVEGEKVQIVMKVINKHNNFFYFLRTQGENGLKVSSPDNVEFKVKRVDQTDIRTAISKTLDFENILEGDNEFIVCQPENKQEFTVVFGGDANFTQKWQKKTQEFNTKLLAFMSHYKIQNEQTYAHIVRAGLSQTLSKIGIQDGFVNTLYGIFNQENKIDVKYSMLLIEIIGFFDKELASGLMENVVELLEDEILYGEETLKEIPVPEHIEALLLFPNPKNLVVLNGLIFRIVFQRVNTMIGKQADYSGKDQVHPVLKTMVEIRWQSQYNYLAAESIYTQSFFYDLLTNGPEQTHDISVSKAMWLIKAIKVLRQLNSNNQLCDKQISSLQKLLTTYFRDQCLQKDNKIFRSINRVGRNRYFTRYFSYQNSLPHIYKIYSKSQDNYLGSLKSILNLTTDHGVRSLENTTWNYDSEFRGSISPYFNYKIVRLFEEEEVLNRSEYVERYKNQTVLSEIYERLEDAENTLGKNRRNQLRLLGKIKGGLRMKVVKDWEGSRRLYGRWAPDGYTYEPNSHLVLINTLFLSD